MFTKSVGVTLEGLPGMQSAVIQQLMQAAQGGKSAQRVAFSSLWDEAASSPTMLGLHQPSTARLSARHQHPSISAQTRCMLPPFAMRA